MADDNKRRLSSDGTTPKPKSKSVKFTGTINGGHNDNTFQNTPPPAHSNTAQPAWVDQLLIRINDLDTKISKIDKVSEDLSYLCSRIENLQSRVGHLEKHTGNMGNTMGKIRKSQIHLTSNVEETKKEVKELKLIMNNYKVRLQISTKYGGQFAFLWVNRVQRPRQGKLCGFGW